MKRFSSSEKWDDPWFRKLSPVLKAFWQFLCDRCESTGLWVVDMDLASTYVGAEIPENALTSFAGRVIDIGCGKWLLTGFVDFQYGKLTPTCNPHKRIIEALEKHSLVIEGRITKRVGTLPTGTVGTLEERKRTSTGKEEDGKGSGENQTAPTGFPLIEHVIARASMCGGTEDQAKAFWNHFESVGWIDRNGHRVTRWEPKFANWIASERGGGFRNGQPAAPKADHSKGF